MLSLLLFLYLAQLPCDVGGKGAQCVTCIPSDRGTVVCRGVCFMPKKDGGIDPTRSHPLVGEANDETSARKKVDDQAKERCK